MTNPTTPQGNSAPQENTPPSNGNAAPAQQAPQYQAPAQGQPQYVQPQYAQQAPAVEGNPVGWGILSFIIPIAGWILAGVWWNTKPKTARACLTCATVAFVLGMIRVITTIM